MDLRSLIGIDMLVLHEPTRQVGANRNRSQIETAEPLADIDEVLRVAGVAREIERKRRVTDHPTAPQGRVTIGWRPSAPVLGRHEMDVSAIPASAAVRTKCGTFMAISSSAPDPWAPPR